MQTGSGAGRASRICAVAYVAAPHAVGEGVRLPACADDRKASPCRCGLEGSQQSTT